MDAAAGRVRVVGPVEAVGGLRSALEVAGFRIDDGGEAPDAVVVAGDDVPVVLAALRGEGGLRASLARMAELEAFAGRVSHDLKTPLAVMGGSAETLLRAWDRLDDAKRTSLLEVLVNQSRKAAAMVDDLIAQARASHDTLTAPIVEDVRAVVEEAVDRLPLRPGDVVEIAVDLPSLEVARADLLSIVSNLLDNAHHYGRGADGSLHVVVGATRVAGHVRISVADDGPGVPADATDVLFRPDGRLPGSTERNPTSTGMGLAIVKRCAERSGGAVGVEPSPGGGARFWASLPAPQR